MPAVETLDRPPSPADALWDLEQLAAYLGLSIWTLRHGYRRLNVPFVRIGGAVRFRPAAVARWAADNETSGYGYEGESA